MSAVSKTAAVGVAFVIGATPVATSGPSTIKVPVDLPKTTTSGGLLPLTVTAGGSSGIVRNPAPRRVIRPARKPAPVAALQQPVDVNERRRSFAHGMASVFGIFPRRKPVRPTVQQELAEALEQLGRTAYTIHHNER